MKHRHLDVAPGTPAEELPAAAVADLLERGDLSDWQPLAAAIASDPDGNLAERVLRLVDAYPMYGTSALWRSWIEHRRDLAAGRESAMDEDPATLAELRRQRGLTQVELAARMEISQSDLSKLERRRDLRLSTLRALAGALGARLRAVMRFPDGREVEVRTTAESESAR
jgi:DNA-binding Xre family transcriptional regulator